MFVNKRRHEFLSREYIWLWISLAFQAGFANAGGFLACARYVSHMTGFGAQVGIALARFDHMFAIEMTCAPLAFLIGAMISGLAIDRPAISHKPPRYLSVMFIIFVTFGFVTLGGLVGLFGKFGEPLETGGDFVLLSLLCFACGMQNACFGSLTRGQIRTTHLTGILTDIGVSFVRLFYLKSSHRDTKILKRINGIRIATFLSFSAGSALSAIVFTRVGYLGFGLLVVSSLALYLVMFYKQYTVRARKNRLAKVTRLIHHTAHSEKKKVHHR